MQHSSSKTLCKTMHSTLQVTTQRSIRQPNFAVKLTVQVTSDYSLSVITSGQAFMAAVELLNGG